MAEASIQEPVFRRIPEPLNQSYSLRCLHRVFPLDNNLLFLDFGGPAKKCDLPCESVHLLKRMADQEAVWDGPFPFFLSVRAARYSRLVYHGHRTRPTYG